MTKCTIITVVKNNVTEIKQCIDSVASQSYGNVEHVIIDGGSVDGTLDILNERRADISVLISEPDSGISDAFNKGIHSASGDLIWIIGSDDLILPGAIERAVSEWEKAGKPDLVFGSVLFVDEKSSAEIRESPNKEYLSRYMAVYHPATLARKEVYEKVGLFDLDYKLAMDSEWIHRALAYGVSTLESSSLFTRVSLGGVSDKVYYGALLEYRRSAIRYHYNPIVVNIYFAQQMLFKYLMSFRVLRNLKHRLHRR